MIAYLKYDKQKKSYKYRRRVPDNLVRVLGKAEFSKQLGKTEQEALLRYPAYHKHIQQVISGARRNPDGEDTRRFRAELEAYLLEMDADPYSSGRTEDEKIARQDVANRILVTYPIAPETGHPDPNDVSASDHTTVQALVEGVVGIEVQLTVKSAYRRVSLCLLSLL